MEQELVLDNDYHGKFDTICYIKVLGDGWKFKYNLKAPFSVRTNEQMMVPAGCKFSLIKCRPGSDLPIKITKTL